MAGGRGGPLRLRHGEARRGAKNFRDYISNRSGNPYGA